MTSRQSEGVLREDLRPLRVRQEAREVAIRRLPVYCCSRRVLREGRVEANLLRTDCHWAMGRLTGSLRGPPSRAAAAEMMRDERSLESSA